MAVVDSLYRYPVKGLSGERLSQVAVGVGETFPMDRAFALENGPSGFDPAEPKWIPKVAFLCLMRNARLASLSTRYDDKSKNLVVLRNDKIIAEENLGSTAGQERIQRFFETFMETEKRGPIRVLKSPGHSFSDVAKKVVSMINLTTLSNLEDRLEREVHPLRFRANLYFEGMPAWSEHDLIGKKIRVGSTVLQVVKRIERCAATEVNPETAIRDLEMVEILYRLRDNADLGIYGEVVDAGEIAERDPIEILG